MTGGKLALPRHQPSPSKDNSQLFIRSPEILRFVFCSGKTCTFWRTLYISNFNSCRGVQLGKIKSMSFRGFFIIIFLRTNAKALKARCFAVEPGVNTQALFPKKADGYHFHYNDHLLFFLFVSWLEPPLLRCHHCKLRTQPLVSLWSLA